MGQGYDNYVTGTFSTQHIRVSGNSYIYEVPNTVASSSGNFYRGCIIYLTTGDGAGQYKTISSYVSNSSGKFIVLESPFGTVPSNGTEYEIYPEVKIYGTGPNVVNAIGRALVNSIASNSVYRVELLNRGSGYTYVYSANVVADASIGVFYLLNLDPSTVPPKDMDMMRQMNFLVIVLSLVSSYLIQRAELLPRKAAPHGAGRS